MEREVEGGEEILRTSRSTLLCASLSTSHVKYVAKYNVKYVRSMWSGISISLSIHFLLRSEVGSEV